MKRIKYLLFTILVSIVGFITVNAASLSMSASSKSVTVGGTVKVTVKASGGAGWEYCLNYDSSVFQLTSGDKCVLGGTLAGNQSVTFTLKALKQGSSTISLGDVSMLDDEANELETSRGSVTINVKEQVDISTPSNESTASDNAYLKSLEVVGYDLSPSFNKKTYSYTVQVGNDIEEVGINAYKEDSNAIITSSVDDIDHISLSEGANKVVITVRAEKGNKLEYVVNINRAEVDPVTVNIDGKDYTFLRDLEGVEKPKYFTESSVEIEEQTVPALVNDVIDYTLVALKDDEGNVVLFSYNDGKYERYIEVNNEMITLIPQSVSEPLEGFKESKEIDINGNKVTVYYNDNDSDFVLLYAKNIGNGETNWYSYDIKEGTIQRYNEVKQEVKKSKDIYFYLSIVFAAIGGLAILVLLIVMAMNSRLKKKNDKLVDKLKEKKVKIVEHPVFETEMEVDSWRDITSEDMEDDTPIEEETTEVEEIPEDGTIEEAEDMEETQEISIYDYADDGVDDDTFFAREIDEMSRLNGEVELKEDSFKEEEPKEEKKKRSRREKKRLKADKEAEEAELKAMRDDFLRTRELEITKELKTPKEEKKSKNKLKKKKK